MDVVALFIKRGESQFRGDRDYYVVIMITVVSNFGG
jgi:hypothetical protein